MAFPLISQRLTAQDEAPAPAGADVSAPAPPAPDAAPSAASEAATPPKVDPGKVVITVGEVKITAGEFEQFLSTLPPQVQMGIQQQPNGRRLVAEELLKVKLLAREAERRKLDQKPQTQAQLNILRDRVLAGALASSLGEDDKADQAYFEEHKADFDELHARHILVSTRGSGDPANPKQPLSDEEAKAKATDIRKRLEGGEDFAKLAQTESDDPGSKDTG